MPLFNPSQCTKTEELTIRLLTSACRRCIFAIICFHTETTKPCPIEVAKKQERSLKWSPQDKRFIHQSIVINRNQVTKPHIPSRVDLYTLVSSSQGSKPPII
jgi:hypothetical protein